MKTKLLAIAIVLMAGLTVSPAARAEIIFDNLNGGTYYATGSYSAVYKNAACETSLDCFLTMQDIPLADDYTLSSITFPLAVFPGAPNEVVFSVYSGSGGLPSALLESWLVSGQMAENDPIFPGDASSFNLVTVNSVLEPLLLAGEQYFFGISIPEPTSYLIYNPASPLVETHTLVQSFDNGATWSLRADRTTEGYMAFRVEGTAARAVPEPATLALVGLGLAAVGLVKRRAKA
ncbi:MAG: hypothetical protein Kow0025_03910 [Thermodesulfovibrionales bacterium]